MKNKDIKFEEIPLKVPSYKAIEKKLTEITNELSEAKDFASGMKAIKKMNKYMEKLETQITVISIRYSLNTTDKKIAKAQDKIDEMSPLLSNLINRWNHILVKVPYRAEIEKKYTPYYFQMIENSLKSFDEKIIPELIEINKLSSQYDRVLGSAQIEFRGGTYNLSQMGKFSTDKDRQTRYEASKKVDEFFEAHEKEIGDIYSKLVILRDTAAKKLGYKSYTELGYLSLGRVDYDAKMVEGYRKQISEEVVPVAQKLYKKQAKRIGIPFNKMYSYDYNLSFLSGNPKPVGDSKKLVEIATHMYDDMSKESGEFFHLMKDHHLLDLDARPGKAPGGYMTYLPLYHFPFIFSNFNGTQGDVNVLTHEVGHAFQGYLSGKIQPPDFRSPTLETCEIHSMSMEFFAWPYMKDFFGEEDEKYRFSHLSDAIEFLPYGISIDEFQHWVYAHPTASHEERCKVWLDIQSRYEPHKKYPEELKCFSHGAGWIRQSHIFGVPFYYIDYTLAQVCAFQFLVEMRKNHERAWRKYVKLCKCGGKYPFVKTLEKNHLRNPFIDGNIKKVIRPLVKILNSFDDSKF
ncbi:MAG: M3 family oligoendopeptidase [Bacilli bacterium]|nr:M3 family oligoendopeptidase [Bacilli bacterium]